MNVVRSRTAKARKRRWISQAELALTLGVSSDYLLGIENSTAISIRNLTDEDVKLLHHTIGYMRERGRS